MQQKTLFFFASFLCFTATASFDRGAEAKIQVTVEAGVAGLHEGDDRGREDGRSEAFQVGFRDGHLKGEAEGRLRDYENGFRSGHARGMLVGDAVGQEEGKGAGLSEGEARGYSLGLEQGYDAAFRDGFEIGHGKVDRQVAGSFERGMTDGQAAGQWRARRKAMLEDYPRGRRDTTDAQRARAPEQHLVINNTEELSPPVWSGPLRALQDWAFAQGAWFPSQPKIVPGELPFPSGTEVGNGGPARMESLVEGLRQLWEDWQGGASRLTVDMNLPEPDFRYRIRPIPFNVSAPLAPDYDEVYRASFQQHYAPAFQSSYEQNYQLALQQARDEARQTIHPREQTRGDAEGYRIGYDSAYTAGRRLYYPSSFKQGKDRGIQESLHIRHDEGLADGKNEGLRSASLEIASAEYKRGFTEGDAKGFAESLPAERTAAYLNGKTAQETRLAGAFRVQPIGAALIGGGDGSVFRVGERVDLSVQLRNYGGAVAPHGKLSVEIEDVVPGALRPLSDAAVLRELPANTEAVYQNVAGGYVVGPGGAAEFKWRVKLLEEGKVIATFPIEGKVTTAP